MTGLIGGCLPIEPIAVAREILKARAVIEETTELPAPEAPSESISETPQVTIT